MSARPQLAFRFRAPDMHTWYRSVTELWRSMSNRQVPCESIVKAVTDKISQKSRANIYSGLPLYTHTRDAACAQSCKFIEHISGRDPLPSLGSSHRSELPRFCTTASRAENLVVPRLGRNLFCIRSACRAAQTRSAGMGAAQSEVQATEVGVKLNREADPRVNTLGRRVVRRVRLPAQPRSLTAIEAALVRVGKAESLNACLTAENPDPDPPSSRRRQPQRAFLHRESVHTFVVRYPWDCSDAKFAEQWVTASAQLMAYEQPFSLLHDLTGCDISSLSVSAILSDASAIADRGFVKRVAFVLKVNLLTAPVADWLLSFSPVNPSQRFEEFGTALRWCDEIGQGSPGKVPAGKVQKSGPNNFMSMLLKPIMPCANGGRAAKEVCLPAARSGKSVDELTASLKPANVWT